MIRFDIDDSEHGGDNASRFAADMAGVLRADISDGNMTAQLRRADTPD
jgi:hypothetical protein